MKRPEKLGTDEYMRAVGNALARWSFEVGLATAAGSAAAHDYWIERSKDAYTFFQGHVYSTHKGEERAEPFTQRERGLAGMKKGIASSLLFWDLWPWFQSVLFNQVGKHR